MKANSSQARRRKLIQRGLLGEAGLDADALAGAHDSIRYATTEDVGFDDPETETAIDQATDAVLSPDSIATEDLFSVLASEPLALPVARELSPVAPGSHAGLAAIQSLIGGQRDVTWVFTGDNVIQGAFHTQGWRGCIELFAERIRGELRRGGDVVINTGVIGDTAAQLLRTLKRRALRFRPEVVGLSLGINDAKRGPAGRSEFRRQIREILDRIRTAGSIPLLILPHPVYYPEAKNRADLPHYVQILTDEAQRDEVPCVDQWSDWLENWPNPESGRTRLADGRVHLNAEAHQHLAALLFWTLGIYDSDSAACGRS